MEKTVFTCKTLAGLEPLLVKELEQLGAEDIEAGRRAVTFKGDQRLLYLANLQLRTALRILQPIAHFRASNEEQLYRQIRKRINWLDLMSNRDTLAVNATTSSNLFRHSKYASLKVKDAIVDEFRDATGRRPNVNVYTPTLQIDVYIYDDEVTVSLDTSGESLHYRGYRRETGEAPINEVLAAGMLLHAGYTGEQVLVDPMCGSGTLAIEAALIAANKAPGLSRVKKYGFMRWKSFNEALWKEVYAAVEAKVKTPAHAIFASDMAFKSVRMAERNAMGADMDQYITFSRSTFEKLEKPAEEGIIVMNPPYDLRLESDDINAFYKDIGDALKQHFTGFTAWIISSNKEAMKNIGLRTAKRLTLFNGPLECKYHKYELF